MKKIENIKIVCLGGGTGLSTVLRGLKKLTSNITAVVTVSDDGGSSGKLRREMGVIPPGDIRNCLVALSEEENLMAKLFQYRFPDTPSLSGHSLGNLLLTAVADITHSFTEGVAKAGQVLAIRGKVLPVALSPLTLRAILADGRQVSGESQIGHTNRPIKKLTIKEKTHTHPEVLTAIKQADMIVLGPGSLYTSLIANLVVGGVVPAIRKSNAVKVYVANIMTQPQETTGYTLSDHIRAIEQHGGKNIFPIILVHQGPIKRKLLQNYAQQNAYPVKIDDANLVGKKVVKVNLINPRAQDFIRHDPEILAKTLLKIYHQEIKN